MRVLVTGAGGFLGSHICQHFGAAGHAIAAVGRFATDDRVAAAYPGLTLLAGMTLPDPAFVRAVKSFRPELVVHCAAGANVADSLEHPYRDFQGSVDGCAYVLHVLRESAPEAGFVLLSSAAIYGNPATQPIAEDARCAPNSPYGYHKWLCELVVEEYRTLFGMRTAILRVFSAYGEGLRRQVVHDLCRRIAGSDPEVRVVGTGHESRDFVHARDVARAVDCASRALGAGPPIYNVASGSETTVRELAALLAELLDCNKPIVFTDEQLPRSPSNGSADVSRMIAAGFRAEVPLREGLAGSCRWFRAQDAAR